MGGGASRGFGFGFVGWFDVAIGFFVIKTLMNMCRLLMVDLLLTLLVLRCNYISSLHGR